MTFRPPRGHLPLRVAIGSAASALLACPQVLDDDFVSLRAGRGGMELDAADSGADRDAGSGQRDRWGSGGRESAWSNWGSDGGSRGFSVWRSNGGSGGQSGTGSSGGEGPDVSLLASVLRHRYGFDGTGAVVYDSVGGANGEVRSGALTGSGRLDFDGVGVFVNLPNGLISGLSSVTLEAWVTWTGSETLSRVFDFGSNEQGEASRGFAQTNLYLSPNGLGNVLSGAFSSSGLAAETRVSAPSPLPGGSEQHVALVVDGPGQTMTLYLNAVEQASSPQSEPLSALNDVNAWLGLSQYSFDPYFEGSMTEFRIYDAPLSVEDLELSLSLGPDVAL